MVAHLLQASTKMFNSKRQLKRFSEIQVNFQLTMKRVLKFKILESFIYLCAKIRLVLRNFFAQPET